MANWATEYVQRIKETRVDKSMPIDVLQKVFRTSKRDSGESELIRNRFIENYLRTVANQATRFSQATNIPLEDLLSEGNYILVDYFSRSDSLPQKSPMSSLINGVVRKGLLDYSFNTISERLDTDRFTNVSGIIASSKRQYKTQDAWDSIYSNFEEFDRQIKKRLTERQYKAFSLYHPLYGIEMKQEEIAKNFGNPPTTRANVSNYYRKALLKVEKFLHIKFDKVGRHQDFEFAKPEYSSSTIEHLNEQLKEKLGIDMARLASGLSLTARELSSFIEMATGVSMNKSQQLELINQYRADYGEDSVSAKAEIDDLTERISGLLGLKPAEFMIYTGILEKDFVRYLKSQLPSTKEEKIRRVITLSQQERSDKEFPTEKVEQEEIELLNRVLNLLCQDRHSAYLSSAHSTLPERLKHAYFPLYIEDPARCMGLLEDKLKEFSGTGVYHGIKQAYDFFRSSEQLEINRLKTPLDDFQKIDVLTLAEKKRHILASETGVGKTLEIIATAEYLGVDKVLIITNKSSTYDAWYNQIKEHIGDEAVVITGDDGDKMPLLERAKKNKWVVTTYETYRRMRDQFAEIKPQMVVVDEADIMNNPGSLRTEAILDTDAEYKYAVSGWVFKNRRSELWPILNWLYPSEFSFRYSFAREYSKGEWGRLKLKYELSHRLIFRPKSLVLPHLGTPEIHTLKVGMNPGQQEEYENAETNFVEWYNAHNKEELPSIVTLSKLHSLRRLALKPKFEVLYEKLADRHKVPNKSVVFCSYIDEARQISVDLNKLGMTVGYFDGQTSAQERQDVIAEFNQNPDYDVLVMSEAGGKSITLTGADAVYLFNPVWTHSLRKQIIDRLHRRGQTREVHAYELITQGTLEENIAGKTEEKRKEYQKTVMDRRGYASWFEENQADIIHSVIEDLIDKRQMPYSKVPNPSPF